MNKKAKLSYYFHACRVQKLISSAFLLLAILLFGNSAYIHAKALLAQFLIALAWERTLEDGAQHKPWPWADTWPVAAIRIGDEAKKLYVLAGASGASLAFGPGHIDGTALPGDKGSIAIGGHRDTHFSKLRDVKLESSIAIQSIKGDWFHYTVESAHVAHSEFDQLTLQSNEHELLLITCYPFDAIAPGGPWRYVVKAIRSDAESET